jgi:hypothetical protein
MGKHYYVLFPNLKLSKTYITMSYGKTLLGELDNKLSGFDYGENLCEFGYGEKCIVKHLYLIGVLGWKSLLKDASLQANDLYYVIHFTGFNPTSSPMSAPPNG